MKKSSHWTAALVVAVVAVLAASANATADVITLDAVADVNTKSLSPTNNSDKIELKHDSPGNEYTRKGYVRFDLSGVDVSQVTAATFRVTLSASAPADNTLYVFGLQDALATNSYGRLGDVAWTEAQMVALSHELAPANSDDEGNYVELGDGVVGFYGPNVWPADTELGTATILDADTSGKVYSISTTNLRNLVNADTNNTLTLLLFLGTEDHLNYSLAAREHATLAPPQLELTTVPEPASCWLAVLGLVGLVTMMNVRRRRG